jgi:hypothetical protein
MPSLLERLAAPGCPRLGSNWDRCGVHYVEPIKGFAIIESHKRATEKGMSSVSVTRRKLTEERHRRRDPGGNKPTGRHPKMARDVVARTLALAALDGVTRHVMVGFSDPTVRSLPPERD